VIPEDRVYFLWAFLFYFILFGTGGGGVGVEGREGGTRRMGTLSIFFFAFFAFRDVCLVSEA
jgi:bacteriorhodopsin